MKLKAFCKVRKNIWQGEGILQNGQRYLSQTHTRQVTSVWLYKELQKFNTQKAKPSNLNIELRIEYMVLKRRKANC